MRFSMLAAFLQALVNADQYLEKADNEDGAFLANMMEGDPRRVKSSKTVRLRDDRPSPCRAT